MGALLLGVLAVPSGPAAASATGVSPARPARVHAGVAGRSRVAPAALLHHSTRTGHHAAVRPPAPVALPGGSNLGNPLPLGSLPLGTYVTNQFEDDGIVFSGQAPFITDDGSSSVNPTISGSPLFQGTVVGTFVKPGTDTPTTVDAFSVEVGYIDNPGSTQMTVYDSNGQQLGVLVATQLGFNQLYSTFPGAASFSVSSVADEPAGWELNTIQIGSIDTNYIAMGDSYSSGEGTRDFPWSQAQGTQCDTGPEAWPVQMAGDVNSNAPDPGSTLNIDQSSLVACQGETTGQLTQAVNGEVNSEIQQVINFVTNKEPPNLLTITIGGNDLWFANVLKACFIGGAEACLAVATALDLRVTVGADSLISTLANTYQEVKSAANGAQQVVVVGYPDLFPQPGGLGTALSVTLHCPWLRETSFPFDTIDPISPYINILLGVIANAQAAINDDMAVAAYQAGVDFVPIPYSLADHELCTNTPYINPLTLSGGISGDRNLGHPNVAGSAAMASAVASQLGLGQSGGNLKTVRPSAGTHPARHLKAVYAPGRTHRASGPVRHGIRPNDGGPLSFSGGTLLDGTVGADYVDYLVATGGNGADTWSVTSGSPPPGLSLDPNSGTITGTPTTPGDYTFTAQVTDSSSTPQTASAQVTIDVNAATALTVGTTAPPDATVAQPYSFLLQPQGGLGAVTWAITSGSLPAGLQLNAATGQLTGTPASTAAGTSAFTVQATDSSSPAQVATASETITVHPASDPLTVTTTTLPEFSAGQDYGAQLTSTGGLSPVTWSVSAGSLPPGVSLDPASGLLSGAPTAAGTYDFTAQVTDGSATATAPLSITIDAPPALTITTAGAFDGTEGSYYSSTFQATGGAGSDQWEVSSGSLPAGLNLDPNTGQVTGIPTQTGNSTFAVTVFDAAGDTATQSYSVAITQVPLTVSPALAPATVGTYYTGNVSPSGGQAPYGWSLVSGTLPNGLSFDSSTGAIVGTPEQSGSFPLQVSVTDSSSPAQQVTGDVTLTVAAVPALQVSGSAPVAGAVNNFYTTGIGYSGGQGPYAWAVSAGTLPPGLALDPGSGMVTGTPTKAGSYPVTIQVTDSTTPTPEVASASLTFTIKSPLKLSVVAPALPVATQGTAYSATLEAAGGVPPYSWSETGSLPAGLFFSSTGQIYGTPTGHGTKQFTVAVTDSRRTPVTATHLVKLVVNPGAPLAIQTTGLDGATQGSSYTEQLAAAGGAGNYTWHLVAGDGTLPAGLHLYGSGFIEGTPTQFGTFTFTVKVTDTAKPTADSATQQLSLDVEALPAAPPSFTEDSPTSPAATATPYSYQFAASGNPAPTFAVTSGQLPTGLKLSAKGLLSGTPTQAGTYTFEVTASNGRAPDAVTPQLQITVLPPPVISSFTPVRGVPGARVVITGTDLENADYVYFNGSYATIKSDTATQIVTAVPEFAGTGPISVGTPGGSATSSKVFTVKPAPLPVITSISPTSGKPGSKLTITGTGLEFTYDVEFGGGVYASVIYTDTSQKVTVAVPSGASAGPVTVYTDGGSATSSQTFTPT